MKKKFVIFLALSSVVLSTQAFGSPADDGAEACWQKGVQAARIAKDYVPGRIYMKFEKLDGDGKTVSDKETWFELRPGETQLNTVKVVAAGKDITQEELQKEKIKKEEEKGGKSEGGRSINLSSEENVPLLTNSKKPVAYTVIGREKDHGVECYVYKFRKHHVRKNGSGEETIIQQGKIWLDAGSGMPVRSSYTLDPLPSFVQQLEMETTYFLEGDMVFIKTHKMFLKAGILFLKKRFRFGFVLGGYRKAEKESQGK